MKNKAKGLGAGSPRSRSVMLYIFFVFISTLLWLFVAYNNTTTNDVEVPVEIVMTKSDASKVHFLTDVPQTLTVSVSARGTAFFGYALWNRPKLKLKFVDYIDGNGQFKVSASQLKKLLGKELGHAIINSVSPGEISSRYTDSQGKKVPIVLDIDINPAQFHTLTGAVTLSKDSVTVYGDSWTLKSIDKVYTHHIKEDGLTDTLRRSIGIATIKGAVIEPKSIEITIPIEKMVTRTQEIQVSVRNAPSDVNVVVFPSKVKATFRVPLSYYNDKAQVTAVVDYNSINIQTPGNKVELHVGESPGAYEDVTLSQDSVEYIIEKR